MRISLSEYIIPRIMGCVNFLDAAKYVIFDRERDSADINGSNERRSISVNDTSKSVLMSAATWALLENRSTL